MRIRQSSDRLSHSSGLDRHYGMNGDDPSARLRLTALVVLHLVISIAHGTAHDGAHVPMSLAAKAFVVLVVVGAPLVGLALLWWKPQAGSWVIASAMAGSFAFGVVNHFVFTGPDHVARVAADWRPLFASTALLLALTEAMAAALAFGLARERTLTA